MQESSTYRAILAEGKEELLTRLLQRRFSTLAAGITASLDKLTSDELNELGDELFDFTSLADLEAWLARH